MPDGQPINMPVPGQIRGRDTATGAGGWSRTRDRVETYFDRTATRTWERLTSDAPVSKIRETVRQGRDQMRALMLSRLPDDLTGVDISPQLIEIAERRLDPAHADRVQFRAGDMLASELGTFDHILAMDSL